MLLGVCIISIKQATIVPIWECLEKVWGLSFSFQFESSPVYAEVPGAGTVGHLIGC